MTQQLRAPAASEGESGMVPAPTQWLRVNCNPSSRGSSTLLWLLQEPGMDVVRRHTIQVDKISIEIIFKIKNKGLERRLSCLEHLLVFQRALIWFPASTEKLTAVCNYRVRGSDAFFWPNGHQTHMWCTDMHAGNTPIQIQNKPWVWILVFFETRFVYVTLMS